MNKLPGSRATSVVLKVGGPLAAAGVVAAACSSGGSQASAPSTPAPTSAATTSSLSTNSSASTVDVRASDGKTFLTDGSGRSLYLWTPDTHTKSMCSGTCATAWPPLTAKGSPMAGKGVIAGDLGTINRADGTKQVTYAGHPLYTFSGDTAAGQTSGEGSNGFGAPWYLVASSGQQITSLSAESPQPGKPSASATSTGGSNAGGGY
jgi:predicted lipoprotein with Yx(FWY)xxD motif